MNRAQLEHLIRAASAICGERDLIILGSQAILGQFPDAPKTLRVSAEADLYPRDRPDLADLIDGAIGELSMFHDRFGYYAQGVGPNTAILPAGWQARLVPICGLETQGATGWCLEIHDLLLSKYVPFREKDEAYILEAIRLRLVRRSKLLALVPTMPIGADQQARITAQICRHFRLPRSSMKA